MTQIYTCALTESCAVSRRGKTPGVTVCEDRDGVARNSRQDVLGAVVADFFVVVHVSLQHLLDPANHTAAGAWPRDRSLANINADCRFTDVEIIEITLELCNKY